MKPWIFIDPREGPKSAEDQNCLLNLKPFRDNGIAESRSLDTGDIMSNGYGPDGPIEILIEVKRIDDLIHSVHKGRLTATQIPRMVRRSPFSFLIYYPSLVRGKGGEIIRADGKKLYKTTEFHTLQKWLTVFQSCGVGVREACDIQHVAWVAYGILDTYRKPWEDHSLMNCFDQTTMSRVGPGLFQANLSEEEEHEQMVAKTFSTFPSIGVKRAKAAAGFFGSVANGVLASHIEWESVVTKSAAKAAVEYVNKETRNVT